MLDRRPASSKIAIGPPPAERWPGRGRTQPLPLFLLLLLLFASPWPGNGVRSVTALSDDVPTNCLEHTVTTGTFDEYFALEDVGNQPSERHPVNFSVTVALGNRQEELGILLSGTDRSWQHPDFARTYEMRLTNVYTVLYRETHKMQAYHSPQDKLFPADRFRLRFLSARDGNTTVLVDDDPARTLLAVVDGQPTLDLRYVSFASRMNSYPIRLFLGCGMAQYGSTTATQPTESTLPLSTSDGYLALAGSGTAAPPLSARTCACPVCAKQRCQVVVKACADSGKDAVSGGRDDQEQQKYYFYFNLYLTKNRTTGSEQVLRGARKLPDDGL